ncbi:MAG: hypothetical protein KAQ74_05520, partial [Dehalococcoidia bacterium]|nr:hypothetical protein [Dehalococcoidia bacterium]
SVAVPLHKAILQWKSWLGDQKVPVRLKASIQPLIPLHMADEIVCDHDSELLAKVLAKPAVVNLQAATLKGLV